MIISFGNLIVSLYNGDGELSVATKRLLVAASLLVFGSNVGATVLTSSEYVFNEFITHFMTYESLNNK